MQQPAAVYLDPKQLTPWASNPRENDHAVQQVADSIARFGFAAPIVARQADLRVIAGHTRLRAAMQLGLTTVPVRLLDVSEHEADALALADNKLGELANWDDQGLAQVLADLRTSDVALDGLGWDAAELDDLIADLDPAPPDTNTEPTDLSDLDTLPAMPPPVCQLGDVHQVGPHALHVGDCLEVLRTLPADHFHAVVTDPPYGLSAPPDMAEVLRHWLAGEAYQHGRSGFMGADWDSFVPGPQVWAEVLRVCRPGAHAVVFAGTRTVDLMGIALRLAGWEVRDCGVWLHYQGFPKSMAIDQAIDKMRDDTEQVLQVTRWIREARDAEGLTNAAIDAAFGFHGMASHWCSKKSQPAVPTLDQVPTLLRVLGVNDNDVPPEIQRLLVTLNGAKGQPGAAWYDRPVVGHGDAGAAYAGGSGLHAGQPGMTGFSASWDRTAPATPEAARFQGYGTGLKPAIEPWLLVRKPLAEPSVARQVLATGTGALNIDACRYPPGDSRWPGPQEAAAGWGGVGVSGATFNAGTSRLAAGGAARPTAARFPANVVHVPKPSRSEREEGLEEQGLPAMTGAQAVHRKEGSDGLNSPRAGAGRTATEVRNVHPTVKPANLMHWLASLVAPTADGPPLVLDPFVGSGTTLLAVDRMGGHGVGIELEPRHADIALARLRHACKEAQ